MILLIDDKNSIEFFTYVYNISIAHVKKDFYIKKLF